MHDSASELDPSKPDPYFQKSNKFNQYLVSLLYVSKFDMQQKGEDLVNLWELNQRKK